MSSEIEAHQIDFSTLPEGCIADIVSLTSPRDASRLALVCSTFKSAADSDAVWDRFLPADYRDFVLQALDSVHSFESKKELYFKLCDKPLIIDQGKKSFWLDKTSGKKCFMNSARDLYIVWGDTPRYWSWISLPEARFPEVAELNSVCWLEIRGRINSSKLSQNTVYAAYLVFNPRLGSYGFEEQPLEVEVGYDGGERFKKTVILDERGWKHRSTALRRVGLINRGETVNRRFTAPLHKDKECQYSKKRGDGWFEIELGEFLNNEENREVEVSVMEVKAGNWKGGIIVQGIEIRPKEGQ